MYCILFYTVPDKVRGEYMQNGKKTYFNSINTRTIIPKFMPEQICSSVYSAFTTN